MFIRIFGLLGLMLASGYFVNGLTFIALFVRGLGRDDFRTLGYRFTVMSLDLFSALALAIAAVGPLGGKRLRALLSPRVPRDHSRLPPAFTKRAMLW